jgi:hypothetical protein
MPGMNGYELAAAVRSDPRTAGMPIIALSSATSPDAVERGRAAGFEEYVAKFDLPGLIAALTERLLERLTRVPLAPPEVAGVLNLPGRIVTAIDGRGRLALPQRGDKRPPMAIGIECKGESYGLVIDAVGEVRRVR